MNLPIYRLLINDEETSGVEYVALVDDPAIMKNWQYFANTKVSFDYDETLSTSKGKEMAKKLIEQGATVYIISARSDKEGMLGTAKDLGIPESRVYATGSNKAKIEKVKELGISKHYDNNTDVINELGSNGEKFVKPNKGERENEFIPRCISYVVGEGKDTEQATAICYSIWKEEHKSSMQIHDEEKRVIAGPLMIADLPIYRQDEKLGEYYVVFDSKTIEQICLKYHYQQNNKNVNLMHDPNQKVQGVFMFNDFIINRKLGVNPPKGYESLPDGSWFGFYKVENPEVWNKVKDGEIRGFSVEGIFEHQFIVDKDATQIEALMERFKSLRSKLANIK